MRTLFREPEIADEKEKEMCTAAVYTTKDTYFGRTLDYEFSYGEEIVLFPRRQELSMRHRVSMKEHYAILGMAHAAGEYPLFYDAVNEKGLGMAGLNFVGNAFYQKPREGAENITQFELIPWILGKCATLSEARAVLENLVITDTPFSPQLPVSPLHWMLADATGSIVVEAMADGIHVHDNPAGVMTNNPPFEQQMFLLNQYMGLSEKQPVNTFAPEIPLTTYSRGMGALGLPGDLSSTSRFARAAFVRAHSLSGESEEESVSQFFHILGSVDQQRGCCEVKEGHYEISLYTSCCNLNKGIYYYTTYENHQISAVNMYHEDLDGDTLHRFPLIQGQQIRWQN